MTRKETPADGKTYAFDYEYDELGNLSKKTYPFGYSLSYGYTNGELTDITDNKGRHIWHLDSKNAYGQTTGYTWGNGVKSTNGYNTRGMLVSQTTGTKQHLTYAYDERTGNITSRSDVVRHQRETFEYDELNRLTGFTLWNNGKFNGTRTIDYAANGNIRSKDGAGEYSYSNRRPHAVAEVDGENDIPSATQTIEYNAFGKADRLTDDDGKVGLDILYGIDGERVMCEWTDSTGSVYKKRLYFGEYEITETNGTKEDVCYINSPDGVTAVMMHHGSTYKIYYICTDHLGSITLLMNDAGNTVERHAYDAWGRKRNVNDWSDDNVENGKLDRGYTGHEARREFGLINMNGRMYDPILGRMLSPDNYVQDPFDLQNYNRYTYCLNNPLKYTDPSGEFFAEALFIGAMVYFGGVMANSMTSDNPFDCTTWNWSSPSTYINIVSSALTALNIAGFQTVLFSQIDGILTRGTMMAGIHVAFNGLVNVAVGNNFFDNWEVSAINGFINGALEGYSLAQSNGTNMWWGNEIKYNRTKWSFFNTNKPDYVIKFGIKDVGSERPQDCVPTTFAEIENHRNGLRTYDDFVTLSKYVEGHGVDISANKYKELILNTFNNSEIISRGRLFDVQYMSEAANRGDIISIHFHKHADNVRALRVFKNKPELNELIFRNHNYNMTKSNSKIIIHNVFRLF